MTPRNPLYGSPVTFTVMGKPVVWKRAGRNGGTYYTNTKQAAYQKTVAKEAKAAGVRMLMDLVEMSIVFYLPMPSKVTSRAARAELEGKLCGDRKDLDNLAKNHMDALNGVAYTDDRQVARLITEKRYSANPRAVVTIEPAVSLPQRRECA